MKMVTVSIIMPNHNYGKYIADAIRSVMAQTISDWECIIIDDASTDNSVAVINKLIKNDKRFRLIKFKEPMGVSRARNAGLDVARGKYIAFLDSDDCYTEFALEMLVNMAETMGAQVAGAQALIVPDDFKYRPSGNSSWTVGRTWIETNPNRFLTAPKNYNWCWVWRRIYHRDLFKKLRFFPEFVGAGEDLAFMLDLSYRTKRIVETESISVYHRAHKESLMQRPFYKGAFDWFPVFFKYVRDNICDKYDHKFLREFYSNMFAYLINATIIMPKINGKYYEEAKQTVVAACRFIPMRYLHPRQRILCGFLRWIK
ncbi:MAG: glycosyltransferase family 2 protein [Alphaproteobacteria bacterium]|nr:glycosyltransferase family 2 protein [Alphaproteobacteria bacterium]